MESKQLPIKAIKRKCIDLEDGDIFYMPDFEMMNDNLFGDDISITMSGTDLILICDENIADELRVLVNGGHYVDYDFNEYCYVIGHYSTLINQVEPLKE